MTIPDSTLDYIKHSYYHRKAINSLMEAILPTLNWRDRKAIKERAKYHDVDKMFLMMFWTNKEEVYAWHRKHANHHNWTQKSFPLFIDMLEAALDWESSGMTKPDKPLNAYDTLVTMFNDKRFRMMPVLAKLGWDYSYKRLLILGSEGFNEPDDLIVRNACKQIVELVNHDLRSKNPMFLKDDAYGAPGDKPGIYTREEGIFICSLEQFNEIIEESAKGIKNV